MAAAQTPAKRLAVVNGAVITEEQVTKAAAGDMANLEAKRPPSQAEYERARLEIMWKALDSIIDDKVLEAEAAAEKITKQQLISNEIDSNVYTPSDEEVASFYQANKAQIPIPLEQARPQLRQYLVDQQKRQYRVPLIARLRRQFGVTTYLDPLRTEVATAGHPSRGPAAAPVTIVEFGDFECPVCGALYPTMKAVEKNYPDKVRLVFRQFPLTSIHPHAQKAAEASLCANDQQKFWEFYDSMFSNQQELTVDDLKKRAVTLKLNTAAFNECLDSGRKTEAIKKDQDEGRKAGVSGTPGLFLNGRFLNGNRPYAELKGIIDDELQRAAAKAGIVGVGNFSHIVASMDKALEFYHDLLGLELAAPVRPFDPNPAIMKMGNTIGAQSRFVQLKVPGSALGVELIEYKDIDRKPARPRFQDPGAANLILRVRDIDSLAAKLKKAGTPILTKAGAPVTIGSGGRNIFVQDPDGFIVELAQAATPPPVTPEASGNVIGSGFEVAIEDTEKTAAFYRDLFGLQVNVGASFNGDKLMAETAGTPGAQFRQSRATIPGSSVAMTFIEFKDIARQPLKTRIQDPGTAILQLMVRDVDSLLKTLKAGGATVVSVGGEAVTLGGTTKIAIVRDPNNLYLELIQR